MADTLGMLADRVGKLRQKRLDLERRAKDVKEEEQILKEQVLKELRNAGLVRATGKAYTISVVDKVRYAVDDWEAVQAWIKRQRGRADDLYIRTLNQKGCAERFDDDKVIDGVGVVKLKDLSITKAGR